MRPDDPSAAPPTDSAAFLDGDLIELAPEPDPELVALGRELAAAGSRARRGAPRTAESRPDRGFEDHLLRQILDDGGQSSRLDELGRSRVVARVRSRSSTAGLQRPRRRFVVFALASAIAAAAVVGAASFVLRPAPSTVARAADVAGGSIVRADVQLPLADDAEIRPGDLVRVDAGGHATLEIGGVWLRLAPGAAIRVGSLAGSSVAVEQLAGRVYHRVDPNRTSTYVVTAAGINLTARGTAFDVLLEPDPEAGGKTLEVLGLADSVQLSGPEIASTVGEGRSVVVFIPNEPTSPPRVTIVPIEATALLDPWLRRNAELDQELGFPLGVLAALVATAATPGPAAPSAAIEPTPGIEATATGTSTTSPSHPESPRPVATATDGRPVATQSAPPAGTGATGGGNRATPPPVRPSAHPTAPPPTRAPVTPIPAASTPTPDPATAPPPPPPTVGPLWLGTVACPGAVVIDWSPFTGDGFARYVTLRNSVGVIPRAYPARGGATEVVRARSTSAGRDSGFDPAARAGATTFYRTLALDAADHVLAASPIVSAVGLGRAPTDLGPLVATRDRGALRLTWHAFDGPKRCFDAYKVVVSRADRTPSWATGSKVLATRVVQSLQSVRLKSLPRGAYHIRIQALVTTQLGGFVVAQTKVVTIRFP